MFFCLGKRIRIKLFLIVTTNINARHSHPPPCGTGIFMEAAKNLLNRIRSSLKISKIDIQDLINNPKAKQWEKVNFETHSPVITDTNLSPNEIKSVALSYQAAAKQTLKHIEKYENEIGYLETDIRHNSITSQQAESSAENIEKSWGEMQQQSITPLLNQGKLLADADQTLRDQLSMHNMLRLLKNDKRSRSKSIEEGYNFYSFVVTDTAPNDSSEKNLANLSAETIRQEKLLENIVLSGLPGLVSIVAEHQVQLALTGARKIKEFIEGFKQNLPRGFGGIKKSHEKLNSLKNAEAHEILANIYSIKETLGKNIVELCHRTHFMEQFANISTVLEDLNTFQRTVKNELLTDLKNQLHSTSSPLNFANLAVEKTDQFFTGFKGILRSIKLMLSSFSGYQSISKTDLQELLVETLQACTVYYGDNDSDLKKMKNYINERLKSYSKPFPYEDLFQLLKSALNTYGTQAEEYFYNYKVKSRAATLGKLLEEIKQQTDGLKSS